MIEVISYVKWFNNEKNYRFAKYKEVKDILIHYSSIKLEGYKILTEGQIIPFQLIETPKGLQALNGEIINNPTSTEYKAF